MGYLGNVNWWAILASTVACFAVGMAWYSPLLFAKPWCEAMGFDLNNKEKMDQMRKETGPKYFLAIVCSFIMAFMMAKVSGYLGLHTAFVGVKLGVALWFGFVATVQLTDVIFGFKKMSLWFINTGYQMVCYIITGVILCVWR